MSWKELPQKRYFRPDEVAEYFSVSTRTIYRLIKEGMLVGIRVSGKSALRIPRESIVTLEKERLEAYWDNESL